MFEKLLSRKRNLFLLFFVLVALLYAPGYKGGFFDDFTFFLDSYKKLGYLDYLMITPTSLYLGVNSVHYGLIALFGVNPVPWFILFTLLQALNGCLLFHFFRRFLLMMGWDKKKTDQVVFTSTVLWLLGPLAVEVVVWRACSHYLISLFFFFAILNWLLLYLQRGNRKYIAYMLSVYLLSTLFLEYFYITPVFVLLFVLALQYNQKAGGADLKRVFVRVFLPMVLIWALYYSTLYLLSSRLVGRFNPSEETFDVFTNLSKLLKFTVHIYLMEYFYPHQLKQSVYKLTESVYVLGAFVVILLGIATAAIFKFRSASLRSKTLFSLFFFSFASCIVILPMWFHNEFPFQGSRYYYLPSAFFYLLLTVFLLGGSKFWNIRRVIMGAYVLLNIVLAAHLTIQVRHSSKIFNKALYDFRWQDEQQVFLLNLPITYNGIAIYGAGNPSNFADHLFIFRDDTIRGKFYDVSSYNMKGRWDGAHVTVLDSMNLKVTLNQYGSWWWYDGHGASDYENDLYKVTFIDNGFSYLLQFKKPPLPGAKFLYLMGEQWKEVDLSKRNEEQW